MRSVTGREGRAVRAVIALLLCGFGAVPALSQNQEPEDEPIVSDQEFEASVPPVGAEDDPEMGRSLESIEEFERRLGKPVTEAPLSPGLGPAVKDVELSTPLPPLETFRAEPVVFSGAAAAPQDAEIVYRVDLNGLGEVVAASERDQ